MDTDSPAPESAREPQADADQAVAAMRCLRPNCLEDRFRFHRGPPVERVEQARDGRYTPPVVAVMRIVPPVFYVQRQVEANGLREAQGSARPGTDASIMAVAVHPAMPEPQTSRRAAAVEQPRGAGFGGNGDVVPLPVDFRGGRDRQHGAEILRDRRGEGEPGGDEAADAGRRPCVGIQPERRAADADDFAFRSPGGVGLGKTAAENEIDHLRRASIRRRKPSTAASTDDGSSSANAEPKWYLAFSSRPAA